MRLIESGPIFRLSKGFAIRRQPPTGPTFRHYVQAKSRMMGGAILEILMQK